MPAGLEGGSMAETPRCRIRTWAQHRVPACRLALERMGIARSMSRKGNRLDNAKAENFFSMAKTEPCCDWEGAAPTSSRGFSEKHIDRYSNVRIKRRLTVSGPVECRLGRAA